MHGLRTWLGRLSIGLHRLQDWLPFSPRSARGEAVSLHEALAGTPGVDVG